MDDRVIWASGHGVVLLAVFAGIAFASGFWGVLIALAPAAYLLVFFPHESEHSPKIILGSHLTALVAGWAAYAAIAQGIAPTSIEPMSEPGLRIVGSALLAFVASTAVFYALDMEHPMAYVTTFTAAIGAFPSIRGLVVAGVAVLCVAGLQAFRREAGPEPGSEGAAPVSGLSAPSNRR